MKFLTCRIMALEPDGIICTSTPSSVGVAAGNSLKASHQIERTIDGLGIVENVLGPRPEQFYEPPT